MTKRLKILGLLYQLFLVVLVVLVVFHHYLLNIKIFNLDEEIVEAFFLLLIIIMGYAIGWFYRKEVAKQMQETESLRKSERDYEEIIGEAFKHIGALNVQIDQVKSIFSEIKKYPENKKDFKYILDYLAKKILGIVNSDFVVFRIIGLENGNTLSEYALARTGSEPSEAKIGNAELLSGNLANDLSCLKSDQRNLKIKVFCVLSRTEISEDQKVFISAVTNQLEMLFLIFTSHYYQDSHIIKQ